MEDWRSKGWGCRECFSYLGCVTMDSLACLRESPIKRLIRAPHGAEEQLLRAVASWGGGGGGVGGGPGNSGFVVRKLAARRRLGEHSVCCFQPFNTTPPSVPPPRHTPTPHPDRHRDPGDTRESFSQQTGQTTSLSSNRSAGRTQNNLSHTLLFSIQLPLHAEYLLPL